jgi:hypothetical protein
MDREALDVEAGANRAEGSIGRHELGRLGSPCQRCGRPDLVGE